MIDLESLPPAIRRRLWQAGVVIVLLTGVVFLPGFTADRWFEHGR